MTPASARAKSEVVMWEARAAAGRLDELVGFVLEHADPSARVYRADDPPRLVLIDPSGTGLPDAPSELLARAPHAWTFEEVPR